MRIKGNIKAPNHWPLCGEFTGEFPAQIANLPVAGDFPAQRASNAENVSIWWRHHGCRKILPPVLHKSAQFIWKLNLKSLMSW